MFLLLPYLSKTSKMFKKQTHIMLTPLWHLDFLNFTIVLVENHFLNT